MSEDKNFDKFIEKQINRINEYALWEEDLNNILSKKIKKKGQQFVIVDKEWIEKWKEYVGFEEIKDKCKECVKKKDISLKKEIGEFLSKINAKQKLEDLGQLKCSKIIKKSDNKKINFIFFDEKSNFLPILDFSFTNFNEEKKIYAKGDFINGKCFLSNTSHPKNEKKIVVLEKNEKTNEINEVIITLQEKDDIKKVEEELSKKTIEEMLKDEKLKGNIIKKEIIKNKNNIEKNTKLENEETKKEKEKKEKEELEKKKREEKEKKEKEEKEKKEKEEKEKKEKEENKLDKKSQKSLLFANSTKDTKDGKEKEKKQLKEEEKNNIIDGISEIYTFNNNIKKEFSEKDKSFLLKCSIINDEIKNVVNNEIYKVHSKKMENPIIRMPSIKEEIKKNKRAIDKSSSLGLDNLGATSYMNATLQCLAHIKRISERIINYRRRSLALDGGLRERTEVGGGA